MRYLLDTDVVIDHFRGKRLLDLKFIQAGSISIITLAELLYGVYKSHNPKKSLETLQKNILKSGTGGAMREQRSSDLRE